MLEMRCPQQATGLAALATAVGPAVQWADDVAPGAAAAVVTQVAAALEHDGLAVAADVGHQFHAGIGAHQCPATRFLGQGVVVASVGYRELVPHIAGASLEEGFQFALVERLVEIAGNRELASGLLELKT
ncbi:hypothetical protein FQZ97_912720 [compost metagenome]